MFHKASLKIPFRCQQSVIVSGFDHRSRSFPLSLFRAPVIKQRGALNLRAVGLVIDPMVNLLKLGIDLFEDLIELRVDRLRGLLGGNGMGHPHDLFDGFN